MKQILKKLVNHNDLTREEAREVMLDITTEKYSNEQIAALLMGLQVKGIVVNEILGFRDALLETGRPVNLSPYDTIDIVRTGGDGKNTFNISTCACFVVAGAGYKVSKHGNYGATSISGASNVIEELGVKFTNDNDKLLRSLEGSNITYMHAPLFAYGMKFVAPTRKALQIPTIFNLLGPLVNPCRPKYQLLGVANLTQMRLYSNVNHKIGVKFGIVNSYDGYDEISLTSGFKVNTNDNEEVFRPSDLGMGNSKPEELFGGETKHDAKQIFLDVLQNKATSSQKDVVMTNAGFAIHLFEPEMSVFDCMSKAKESIESGKAFECMKKFVELNS